MTTRLAWSVDEDDTGTRLDRFVALRVEAARHQVQRWIDDGLVQVNGRAKKAGDRLQPGSEVTCTPPEAPTTDPRVEPEDGPVDVLYEDDHLTVIDKPAGLTVHPGAGRPEGTLVHRLLFRDPGLAGVGGPGRPGIVHRLDKDTTGVMVVARTAHAHRALSAAFASRAVEKHYVAIAYGVPRQNPGAIDLPIGRDLRDRKRMAIRSRGGRPARTTHRTAAHAEGLAVIRLGIETGRTHQIRIHLKAIGHPLVGDPVYGEARWRALAPRLRPILKRFPRPALHAETLAFAHPATGEPLAFTATVPNDLQTLWLDVSGHAWPVEPGVKPARAD